MEGDDHITVNQHFVPRCYLKNFAEIKGKDRKEKAFISFYQFSTSECKSLVPTKSICYKEYFYGKDGVLENRFAEKEKEWGRVLRQITNCKEYCLTKEDERLIKEFVVFQNARTVSILNHYKVAMSEAMSDSLVDQYQNIDETYIREIVANKMDSQVSIIDIVKWCNKMLGDVEDLAVSIIKFSTQRKLITSDMPVLVMNPICYGKAGMACVGINIILPVSLDTAIMVYDSKIYKAEKYIMSLEEDDVVNMNKYQVISAEDRIMTRDITEFSQYTECKELTSQRIKYKEKRKALSGYDGVGTFIGIHGREIKYLYRLSFINIPRELTKIPKECIDVFERKYDEKARFNLIICAYKLPAILKKRKDFDFREIKKRSQGYMEFLHFMEDYWGLSREDRILTPDIARKLDKIQMQFFPVTRQ